MHTGAEKLVRDISKEHFGVCPLEVVHDIDKEEGELLSWLV